jgi:hypothetical protein
MQPSRPTPAVGAPTLRRAAEILGGRERLRRYLKVSALSLAVWMAGAEPPPVDVFLKAVDVIAETQLEALRQKKPGA